MITYRKWCYKPLLFVLVVWIKRKCNEKERRYILLTSTFDIVSNWVYTEIDKTKKCKGVLE